jgi:CBS domain-containing protein
LSTINSVSHIMIKNVMSTEISANLIDAARIMTEKGVGCVVITENGTPVGVLTETDIMKEITKDKDAFQKNVGSVMSQPLVSVPPDTPVVRALDLMRKKEIRRLPVVNGRKLEGLVTVHRDLLFWALTALRTSSVATTVLPRENEQPSGCQT